MVILLSLSVKAERTDDLKILAVDNGDVVAKVMIQGYVMPAIETVFSSPDEDLEPLAVLIAVI
jgi:hypothetical protein